MVLFGQIIASTEDNDVLFTNIPPIENVCAIPETRSNRFDDIIEFHCKKHGIDQELVRIIIERESNFNPRAVSRSGAIGLMQLMPETAELLGVEDSYNPWDNIGGGVRYLRDLFDMFGGDLELTLAAYHAGPGLVKRLNRVPTIPETMAYVDYIMARYGPGEKKVQIYFSITKDGTPFFTNLPK